MKMQPLEASFFIRGLKTEKQIERFLIIGLEIQTENRLIISDWEFLGLDLETFLF